MKKQIVFLAGLVLLVAAVFTACRKDDTQSAATELELQTTSTDLATVEDLSEQGEVDADQAIEERGGGPNTGCPTITSTAPLGTFPNTITVDFGTDGCLRPNGRTLKGQIIIEQSAQLNVQGATRTVTYQDFFVDEVKVTGTHTAINNGLNAAGLQMHDAVEVVGAKTIMGDDQQATPPGGFEQLGQDHYAAGEHRRAGLDRRRDVPEAGGVAWHGQKFAPAQNPVVSVISNNRQKYLRLKASGQPASASSGGRPWRARAFSQP